MKKLLGTLALACFTFIAFSQKIVVSGIVLDNITNQPLSGATVTINNQSIITDDDGVFVFKKITKQNLSIAVSSIGYANFNETITSAATEKSIIIKMKSIALNLQALEVKSIRASNKAPFTKTNLSKEEIAKVNLGQDLPFILNQTPSVVVNADAGNGVGYTGIRIRGTDATRINVTLNGIPFNDAESQGTFFVNLPDFSSSVNSIQVQRGVGTSSNGTGAFGATINLSTNELNEKAYSELNNSFGSFNTWKNTVKVGSGLIDGHFTVDARLSQITSDGYIDRAKSNLQSFAISTAYLDATSSLRFNIFHGKEKTYQAWNGVPDYLLESQRTFNSSGSEKAGTPYDNETDNYKQTHYQLFYNKQLKNKWNFSTAAFLTRGLGYYENYRADRNLSDYGLPNIFSSTKSDLIIQQWLDNYFYGQLFSFQKKTTKNTITIGGGWSNYEGLHYGKIIWAKVGINNEFKFYNNYAQKSDANIYVKWEHQINSNLQLFADVQYRNVAHKMNGFKYNPTLLIDRKFDFVNPKFGLTYNKKGWQSYFSYALANKEPNRDDFEAGQTLQPKAEMLHDFELGTEKKTNNYHFAATIYYMLYKDQLVLTGKINDVGSYTRTNVPSSYRLGLELQGGYVINNWLNANANLTLSNSKIKSFTEFVDDYDNGGQVAIPHNNTDITLSPNVIAGGTINIIPTKNLELSLLSKYVSKQYLDNAQDNRRMLESFYTQDFRASYTIKNKLFKEWYIIAQANNIFDKKYEPSGYTFSYISGGTFTTENFFYPMAGTNFMLAVNIKM
jgi:iron complex outermembrane receptor protein